MPTGTKRSQTVRDEDAEAVRAINSGQGHRFQQLVEKYQQKLFNFGLRMCGEAQDAEDMVQEAFLNAFRYLEGFRFETKFRNWLYRVAMSACLKAKRKTRASREETLSLEEFFPEDPGAMPAEVPPWARLPLERVLSAELSRRLQEGILDLPPDHRSVLVLRDMEGLSTAETAQVLEITPANVKVRLHRARLFLRARLKDYFENAL
jgi:RNA polymerase sigma-70 factor (ECF subfamily)